ncbi:hypothetical protein E2C01_077210 [Portunus trituberculatus]|uniref:Uncharacterized protein n=1 Tax=Portunus trituberculatus TaxID=210409 RepID=A0A5B7IP61_PORTR|nr:hypothetical protein [Portunus trituberculatus]
MRYSQVFEFPPWVASLARRHNCALSGPPRHLQTNPCPPSYLSLSPSHSPPLLPTADASNCLPHLPDLRNAQTTSRSTR